MSGITSGKKQRCHFNMYLSEDDKKNLLYMPLKIALGVVIFIILTKLGVL